MQALQFCKWGCHWISCGVLLSSKIKLGAGKNRETSWAWTKERDNTEWMVSAASGNSAKAHKTFPLVSCSTSELHPISQTGVIWLLSELKRNKIPVLAGSWQESWPLTAVSVHPQLSWAGLILKAYYTVVVGTRDGAGAGKRFV